MASDRIEFGDVEGVPETDLPITEGWKKRARERLKEMRRRQEELAEHIGCAQSNISQTVGKGSTQERSQFAWRISVALGIRLPPAALLELMLDESDEDEVYDALASAHDRIRRRRKN